MAYSIIIMKAGFMYMGRWLKKTGIFAALICSIVLMAAGCNLSFEYDGVEYTIYKSDDEIEKELDEVMRQQSEAADKNNKKDRADRQPGQLEVHYIDIGQGDATLIMCDGAAMLIDAGDNSKGTAVQNYLQKQGIKELDYVIGTHPDADHIGGLDVVLYKFDCKTVIMPDIEHDTRTYDDVIQTMKAKNYKNTLPKVGDTYSLGSAEFTVIAPNHYDYGDNNNNYSVGIILQNGGHRFLFIGDAEKAAEEDIIENDIDISADVYKVAHHGSDTASIDEFLDEVKPQYAVISCGEDNRYGHPDKEVLQRLKKRDIATYRTDKDGTVIAYSDGSSLTWECGQQ